MASTSVSSIQKNFKYDVFLSFRGEDTRKTFVDHLYYALQQKGIITYKDEERIEKGERISEQLLRSIEESRFHIIVFSKNYASSSWCLDELIKIMECHKMNEQTAYPVFYDVEPTQVRNQSGSVGEAFELFTRKRKRTLEDGNLEKEEDVGRWRNALIEAAGLAGMELKNTFNGYEAKLIQQIVQEVSLKLQFFNVRVDGKLVGMESRVKNVVSSLEFGFDDVRMVGIKGIGGGGKTTLAHAVFEHISVRFEGTSFVENVREVSKGSLFGLKELQKQVLSAVFNDQSIVVAGVFDGKSMMRKMMPSRKVLVVLDDVDDIGQLEALAGELAWFKPGSRIIITTRDEQVLKAHRVNFIHDVSLLSREESICLFSRYAFGREIPNQGYEELSSKVVRYAAGLPLTVKVLGSHLCGRSKSEWEDAIQRLKTIPLKETLEKLELSYNGLENDQKEIFLDIACILKGATKKKATRILESCGFRAQIGLRVLEQKSLISISKDGYTEPYYYTGLKVFEQKLLLSISKDDDIYYDYGFYNVDVIDDFDEVESFLLHDHIKEMGLHIVRRLHPDEPKRHSRLWIKEEIKDILVNELGTEETKCIFLEYTDLDASIIMKGLRKMKELRLLYVEKLYSTHEVGGLDKVSLYLPNSLQSLYWHKYPFCCLPKTFQANKLVNLEMVDSNISKLVEGGERKVLSKLKFLNLRNSKLRTFDLMVTPHLEELDLGGCSDLVELQMAVECLNLKILNLSGSKVIDLNLGLFPHLHELNLRGCSDFVELQLPVKCSSLKILNLSGSKVSDLNLGLTPNLERVYLRKCYCLQKIHAPVGCLKKLVLLLLEDCSCFLKFKFKKQYESADFESVAMSEIDAQCVCICPLHPKSNLPDFDFGCKYDEPVSSWSGNLEKLISSVSGLCACKNIEYLSATICGLQQLRELTLEGSIPGNMWQLKSPEKLSLRRVEIQHLPDDICMLKHLKSLKFYSCWLLEQLPEHICRLDCLEELDIDLCQSLRDIPNNISKMKCLKYLHLTNCCQVKKLPEEFGRLECLKELNIDGAGIGRLPLSIFLLKGLRIIGSLWQLELCGFTSFTKVYAEPTSPYFVEL